MARTQTHQNFRALAHLGFGAGVWALREWGWAAGLVVASCATLFNLYLEPRLAANRLRREDELQRRMWGGDSFPLAILLALFVLRRNLDAAAALWAMVAVGDSAAGIVGRTAGSHFSLPWNPLKSWPGSIAYVVMGSVAATLAWQWVDGGRASWAAVAGLCTTTACIVAWMESIVGLRDDNVAQTLVGAFALWVGVRVGFGSIELPAWSLEYLVMVAGAHGVLALVFHFAGAVRKGAAVVGAGLGILVFLSLGWSGWVPFALMVGLGFAVTWLGQREGKSTAADMHEEDGRTATQILAKGAVAAVMACVAVLRPDVDLWRLLFAGALAAAAADTLATEIGRLTGGRVFLLWKLRTCPSGTPGGVTWAGTGAAIVGSVAVALAAGTELLPTASIVPVTLAGVTASLAESLLAPPMESLGLSTHEVSNLLMTVAGAMLALWISF